MSLTTIKHLNAAIHIVNKRIENYKVPTDATLVIVATMAIIEKHRGSHENWSIHMEGLRKLVTLRGGLESLESQPLAMGKLYRYRISPALCLSMYGFLNIFTEIYVMKEPIWQAL
ncbi:hypothetical protein N7490_009975 [Penicillium lividum]|nr:hypothetical protein N7490_009975 [Penicillium lividum]